MIRKIVLVLSFFLIHFLSISQNTMIQTENDKYFREGLELFDKQHYSAARTAFEEYLAHQPNSVKTVDAQYYVAYCALTLYHNDGEFLLDKFVTQYQDHPRSSYAYYELGKFYFSKKDYTKAISYLERTDVTKLKDEERIETRFKLGYAHFSNKAFDKSYGYFNIVKKTDNNYSAAANYYAGFIAFRNGTYDDALADFKKAEQNEAYASIVPYMILNVYYKQQKYDELFAYGEEVMNSGRNVKNLEDFSLMIAESYYRKGEYDKAAEYFDTYIENRKVAPDAEIKYRLAYSQYVIGDYQSAEKHFKNIAGRQDSIGQYASYYLGNLYLKQGNKNFAKTAFYSSGKKKDISEVQEESLFKLAKINYDLQDFEASIDAANQLIDKFPQSKRSDEINGLLSEAFLNTRDYSRAVTYIEKIKEKTPKIKRSYQKVAYLKGTEIFNNGKYYEAVQMFSKSLQYPQDRLLMIKAHFWSAEAYSIGRKWERAIDHYSQVLSSHGFDDQPEYLKSKYGIGYAYYNTRQYRNALDHFDSFIDHPGKNINDQFYDDAILRLADCYYVSKDYINAKNSYNKAIRGSGPDKAYAYFQKGVIDGIQNNVQEAKANFDIVIKKYSQSNYLDNAIYQKAQLDFEQGNYQTAIDGFTFLIVNKPGSSFVPHALLKRGFSNYNLKKYNESIRDYKEILEKHLSHQVAESALSALQEVLTLQNRIGEFDRYLTKYKTSNPQNKSLQNIEYETAKSLYNNQEYQKAIGSFKSYAENYRNTGNAYEAKYYIAESYYRLNKINEALEYYYEVEKDNRTDKVNRAVQRIADLELANGNFNKAIQYFQKLASNARNKRQSYNAWAGLMTSYFQLSKYDSVKYYANLILEKGNISANASHKATLYLGKAAYKQEDFETAIDEFMTTSNAAKDENGAEAQYLMGSIFYKQERYKQSIETLIDLNTNFGLYEEWVAKSFLLIAENYVALKEYFQAEATLNSIIDKSPVGVAVTKAKEKLIELKEIQKNQQRSSGKKVESDTTFQEIEN